MEFKDKLKAERERAGLTQKQLAQMVGLTDRTIQNYEHGRGGAARFDHVRALAGALNIKTEELVEEIPAKNSDSEVVAQLVSRMQALFSGGELTDGDKEAAVRAITEAYWESKQINKKYGRKKK
ncbi:MAG: helix-turn-helix domain-containing protein [Ruminococcus sp.]|jgi:transcriptional regulator with XRE-family HTH domain|nr:helix-turn-helix domain-containing protein [Ruminococcus sp.]